MVIKYWKKQSLDTQRGEKGCELVNTKILMRNPKIKGKGQSAWVFCKGRMGLDPHKYPFRILPFDNMKF